MAEFIKTLWSDEVIQPLAEDQDLNMMFDRSLESYVRAQGGNSIVLPSISAGGSIIRSDNLSILGGGLPLAIKDVIKGGSILNIYEYTYGPVNIRKIDDIQSNMALLSKHTTEIAQAFKEHMFTHAAEHIMTTVHTDNRLQWTGSGGTKFTFADLQAGAEKMNAAKIMRNNRFCALPTSAETDLSKDDYLKNWFAVNQSFIQNGQLPQLSGFGFVPSVNIPITLADGSISGVAENNTKKNVVGWRKDHVNLVIQTELEITGSEDATMLGFVASFTVRYGLLMERDKAAFQSTQQ